MKNIKILLAALFAVAGCSAYPQDSAENAAAEPSQKDEVQKENLTQDVLDRLYAQTGPLLEEGKTAEALAVWEKALADAGESGPARSLVLLGIGDVHKYGGDLAKAEEFYGKSSEANPSNPYALERLAELALAAGNSEKTGELLKKARAADPGYMNSYVRSGILLKQDGNLREALKVFVSVINSGFPDPMAYNEAGVLLLMNFGKPKEAAKLFETALELDPDNAQYINNLANAYMAMGEYDTAIGHYRRSLELAPDDALTNANLAATLVRCEKLDEAKKYAQRAY